MTTQPHIPSAFPSKEPEAHRRRDLQRLISSWSAFAALYLRSASHDLPDEMPLEESLFGIEQALEDRHPDEYRGQGLDLVMQDALLRWWHEGVGDPKNCVTCRHTLGGVPVVHDITGVNPVNP